VVLAAVVVAMFVARNRVLVDYGSQAALANWQAWRDDVQKQQENPGPVTRRVPKSSEPPALVLMRDYFVVSLVGATVFTSTLYWITAWFITGALQTDSQPRLED